MNRFHFLYFSKKREKEKENETEKRKEKEKITPFDFTLQAPLN